MPGWKFNKFTVTGFDPQVGKIPRRAWQPTPVFLPGESPWTEEPGGLQSMVGSGVAESDTTVTKHGCQHHSPTQLQQAATPTVL